ncbi:uncharacterized protein EV154DRAFT_427608 [Mucor mucedo]|uniref:uncharacterized protein n=1 Tax=Mucor mucedo TaxID=29922 RepID=UPI00221EAE0D|nr:uncharacterized protein EV154DRAFT_427608 [Mucor mucedo]KAI7885925.1 hypothetical protein EV154DRAFT_427608 [Mucor mucedo]
MNSLTRHSANLMARAGGICTTQTCKDAATSILHDLDVNVDPCSDFYQYTSVGTFNNLRNDNIDGLRDILESTYEDLLAGVQSLGKSDDAFINPSQVEKDRANFNKIKAYYESCMDETTIDSLGPTPIFPSIHALIDTLGFQENEDGRFTTDHVRQLTEALIYLGKEGVDSLITFGVAVDDINPNQYSISVTQPSLGLPSREYYDQPEMLTNYRNGLISILSSVLGNPRDNSATEELRRIRLSENKLSALGQVEIENMVDRFIDFESRLAKITLPNDEFQNPLTLYNPMPISELHQRYPVVNWIKLFRSFLPEETSLPEHVIVVVPRFLQDLTDWLANSVNSDDGVTTQNIREFFIIKTILSNIQNVDKATRELYRNMNSKISSGTTEPPPRSRSCISQTSNTFGQLLGRYFVMKNFGGERQREQVGKFMDNIKSSWSSRLQNVDWLDSDTRTRALDKVSKLNHKEAYSIVTPDDRSPASLEEYYATIQVNPRDFFSNQKSALGWSLGKEWEQIGQAVDKNTWYMNPHEVNAYYTPTFNEIVVPAGILQSPFYNSDLPQYLNYGGIGVVIGHEITHAFDNSGRLYDGDGRLNTWWSNDTTQAFEEKSQCFINQYGKFTVDGPDSSKLNVNGKMTLGENLADNGGVNAALMSMRKSLTERPENNLALPGLENLSPEQLFFINFGRVWCSDMRPEMAVQRVRSDVHSPAKVRVNAAVQNSPEFANAFQCGGPGLKDMNPVDKCTIW